LRCGWLTLRTRGRNKVHAKEHALDRRTTGGDPDEKRNGQQNFEAKHVYSFLVIE
jgi:hypothetical protein